MAKKTIEKKVPTSDDAKNAKDKLFDTIIRWQNDSSKWENIMYLLKIAETKDKGGLRGLKSKIKRLEVNQGFCENMIKGNKNAKLPYEVYEKELESIKTLISEYKNRLKE